MKCEDELTISMHNKLRNNIDLSQYLQIDVLQFAPLGTTRLNHTGFIHQIRNKI